MKNLYKKYKKSSNIIGSYIKNNYKDYIITCIIFVIGVLLGITFVNNLNIVQSNEITNYLTTSLTTLKNSESQNTLEILKISIQNNIFLVLILWLMGSTVIGLFLVFLILCFKGFCVGYTISLIILVLGTWKGIIMFFSTMFFKNIIAIPCIIALSVSGIKVNKTIMQDKIKENIKVTLIRHTLVAIFILILLILTSFLVTYISQAIFKYSIKYI